VVLLERILVRSGREDSLQLLLVSDFVGVLSRGDFCGSLQILRGSKRQFTRRSGDRPGNFLLSIGIQK